MIQKRGMRQILGQLMCSRDQIDWNSATYLIRVILDTIVLYPFGKCLVWGTLRVIRIRMISKMQTTVATITVLKKPYLSSVDKLF